MIKKFWFVLMLFASLTATTLAHAASGCGDYGRCFELTIKNSLPNVAEFSINGGNCYQGDGGTFYLAPGETKQIGIARDQSNGCSGKQGYFNVIVNGDTSSAQGFQFDNSDNLGLNGTSPKYYGALSPQQRAHGGWLTYTWSVAGTWDNPPICNTDRCFPLFVKNSLNYPVTWALISEYCYQGNQPQPFTVGPGQTYQISLARDQSNGCNGKQGKFGLQPLGSLHNEVQQLNFSNHGQIGLSNTTYSYSGNLSRMPSVSGAYQWDVNSTAGPTTPVAGCGDRSRCFWLNLANRSGATATFNVSGGSCYEGVVGSYIVPPGEQQHIGIARVQSSHCNGEQGNFTVDINSNGLTALNFSNDADLSFSSTNPTYAVKLSPRSVTNDGWFFYDLVLNEKWQNPAICDSSRCFQLYINNAYSAPITWKLNPGNCYQGNQPGEFIVQPNSHYQIALARLQGFGCDGIRGEFNLQPVGSLGGEVQNFSFSNGSDLRLSNLPKSYLSSLSERGSDNAYTYTVDANITHAPSPTTTTIGDWSNPSIKLFNFTTNGFWPNFYQSCHGVEVYHNQHVVRLSNDDAGNAYFMVSQSREHNGYITMLRVEASNVDRTTDVIKGEDGSVAGTAIWQQVYSGIMNGYFNPVGNWNHPGKMAYMDGILAVAAQNWDLDFEKKIYCGNWYNAMGTSEDKVLFYDMRNVTTPRYLGAITASQLGVPNHELGTVGLAFVTLAGKYLMVAGGGDSYTVLAANSLNPSIANWTAIRGGAVFSGQHGLAFDRLVNGSRQLVYFDASREDGAFKFTPFSYSANAPYLSGAVESRVPVKLPGSNRDWDASSAYVSPVTQKPIVYTVRSVEDTSNYQLYQVVPSN